MSNSEESKENKIKVILMATLIFLMSIAGVSYAYFTIQVTGNDLASSMNFTTANMSLVYNDVQIVSDEYIQPGWTDSKTLTVTNNGNVEAYYTIVWRDLINEITNGELVISATCVASSGTCNSIPQTQVPTYTTETHNVNVKKNILIPAGVTHTYTFTILFKETGSNQNYNQGKLFNGTLNIIEADENAVVYLNITVPTNVAYIEMHSDPIIANVEKGLAYLGSLSLTTKTLYHTFIGYNSNDEVLFNKKIGFKIDLSLASNSTGYINEDVFNVTSQKSCIGRIGSSSRRILSITFASNYNISSVSDTCSTDTSLDYSFKELTSSINIKPINPGVKP